MSGKSIAVQKHDAERDPKWPEFRDAFIAKNPACVVCGKGKKDNVGLQAHHIFPFHYCINLGRKDLELDDKNLITLCENEKDESSNNHHLLVGHLDDFESSNLDVVSDARITYKGRTEEQIKADAGWQSKKAARLPHLDQMSPNDKQAFKWAMNTRYPKAGQAAGPKPATLPKWIPADLRK
jgi:hypothetical protein